MSEELSKLQERVARIERQNRRMKFAWLLTVGFVGLGLLTGAMPQQVMRMKTVEAEQFILKDAAGNRRGGWLTKRDGWVMISLLSQQEKEAVMMGVSPVGLPSLLMADKDGKPRAAMGVGLAGAPSLHLASQQSKAGLAITGGPSPGISLSDDAGLPRLSIGISPEGSPNLQLFDRHTMQRLAATIGPDGAPSLHLKDAKGEIAWNAGQ